METPPLRLLVIAAVWVTVATTVTSLELTAAQIDAATARARESIRKRRESDIERARLELHQEGAYGVQPAGCPFASQRHLHSRRATKSMTQNVEAARLLEETTKELMRSFKGTPEEARQEVERLRSASLVDTEVENMCQQPNVMCDPTQKYRQPDGTCNNLQNPGWGSRNVCMRRLLAPAYADGVSAPRVPKSGNPLPDARKVSYTVHPDVDNPAKDFTHMVMQVGQFIDHDFALAPFDPDAGEIVNLGNPNNVMDCCSASTRNTPGCFSIDIPSDDPFFAQFGQTCMNMPRSAPCTGCTLGYREQHDVLTSYIDGSQIYGSTLADTMRLRQLTGGLLKSQVGPSNSQLLPRSFHPDMDRCSNPSTGQYCFRAGDERANEHPGLTCTHTLWMRQHNRVAAALAGRNLGLSDEQLFQTSKRIVESQFAHIVYNEWLPLVLGPSLMKKYKLTPKTSGYTTYNAQLDATMINEVAAAAFRIGHTLIQGDFFLNNNFGNTGSFELQENFFFPFDLYNGSLDNVLRGLMRQPAQDYDSFVTDGVTHHLYRLRNETFGLDLIALNLQRGREHGLRPYVDYFRLCTGKNLTSFDSLKRYVRQDAIDRYKELYEDVADIDLFTAAISEFSVDGGIVGPTFGCLLGNMFNRLKYGDRFFYEHGGQAGSFKPAQLEEIRKTTYAKILCDNGDNIFYLPTDVFRPSGISNFNLPCFLLSGTDLRKWP